MPVSDQAVQRFSLLMMTGVVLLYCWCVRAWMKGPQTLDEIDRETALCDKRRRVSRPLWEKKLMAYWRLSERRLNGSGK